MFKSLPPLSVENQKPLDFYDTREEWLKEGQGTSFIDDASRTFTTIETSGDKCHLFNKDGQEITREEFEGKYNSYSGEDFIVVMNKKTSAFIIKPSAGKIRELSMRISKKIKEIGKKAA